VAAPRTEAAAKSKDPYLTTALVIPITLSPCHPERST
jgi:hypothetical protein